MAGRFMNKDTVESEAKRLEVNLDGLTWPQKQKAIMDAQKKESKELRSSMVESVDNKDYNQALNEVIDMLDGITNDTQIDEANISNQGEEVLIHVPQDPMDEMRGKTVMISPEMAPTSRQLFGYDEELGDELVVEEVQHDVDSAYKAGKDLVTGTYTVTNKTGRKVIAHTALPKQGAGITFRPDQDRVPVVTFQGRKGYLWTHHRLPNIKQLLIESGYYEDYRTRFKDEPFVWHAAGKLLCCDISLAESVLRDIERKEREERLRNNQNQEFIKNQLGV